MEWTKADTEHLRAFRNYLDSDDIKLKQEIKQRLLDNKYIIKVLANKELEEADAEPDDYFGINIKPYYMIPETQTSAQNIVCFETSYEPRSRWETVVVEKYQQIIFYILCHSNNAIEPMTSVARHDLLAALIMEEFNFKVLSCGRIHLLSDKASVTDTNYLSRTLVFSCKTDSNIVKTKSGSPRIINKDLINV